jgi:hypothetical protein
VTEEPAVTEEASINRDIISTSEDGAYTVTATRAEIYTTESETVPPTFPDFTEGEQLVLVTASLLNNTADDPVEVERDHIALIDTNGDSWEPLDVEAPTPTLYDQTLALEENVVGFALFSIPEDVTPQLIQWCPEGDCPTPLESVLTLVER